MQKLVATSLAALLVSSQLATPVVANAQRGGNTATPIKHLVVIFQKTSHLITTSEPIRMQ